jgi:RHS repeat-associated protein
MGSEGFAAMFAKCPALGGRVRSFAMKEKPKEVRHSSSGYFATRSELPLYGVTRRGKGYFFIPAVRHFAMLMLVLSVGLFAAHRSQAQSSAASYGTGGSWRFAGSGVSQQPPSCNPPLVFTYSTDVGALEASALAMGAQCQSALNTILQQLGQQNCGGTNNPNQVFPVNSPGPFQETTGTNFQNVQFADYNTESNTGGVISCFGSEIAVALFGATVEIWTCPVGQVPNFFGGPQSCTASLAPYFFLVLPDSVPPPAGPSSGSATAQGSAETPEPINPATGNESLSETDYRSGDGRLQVTRTYNSSDLNVNHTGIGWRTNFLDRALVATGLVGSMPANAVSSLFADPGSACTQGWAGLAPNQPGQTNVTATWNGSICTLSNGKTLTVYSSQPTSNQTTQVGISAQRADGSVFPFSCTATACTAASSVALTLAPQTGGGYLFTDEQDSVEAYNANGQLVSITARGGYQQTLTYTNGLVSSVSDSFGRTLTFQYNARGFLQSVTTPTGLIQYSYNAAGTLVTVTYPDLSVRTYVYGEAQSSNLLTGVTDENNSAYATIGYDSSGRATIGSLTGGVWSSSVGYAAPITPTVTDAFGVTRTYSYSTVHGRPKLTSIAGGSCNTCGAPASQTYDAVGFISSRTDYNGNTTCYQNDPVRGLELFRVEGFGPGAACPAGLSSYIPAANTLQRKISTVWSPTFRIPLSITEPNRTISFAPDTSGNVLTKTITDTSVTPNVARTWTYTYNSFGQVITAKGPRTDIDTTVTYNYYNCATGSQCGQINTITNAQGQITTFNTYDANGNPLTITDANGVLTTLAYDARERLISRQVGSETIGYAYYPTGQLQTVTQPDGSTVQCTYNAAHQLTDVTDGIGNHIHYTVDAMGNRTAESDFDPSSVLSRTHSQAFNTLNQLLKDVGAANTSGVTTNFGYDTDGNQTSVNAPLSRNSASQYDALNHLTQVTDPANGVTRFGYDANDNLTGVVDPRSLQTSYSYNGFGDLTQRVSPDSATSGQTYDSGGNVRTSTDARGAVASYSYDALNRLTTATYQIGGTTDQTINYSYDTGANGKGRMTGASDANHSMSWPYDALGRVTQESTTINQPTYPVALGIGYSYTNGNLTSMSLPFFGPITYGYNSNHQVTSVTVSGISVLSNVVYEPFGTVRGWTWGNGTTEVRLHNTDGNQSLIAGIESVSIGYDNAYRIIGATNSTNSALSWAYGYDNLDRLTSASKSGTALAWSYDANGNRLQQSGAPTTNALSTPATFTFNARGRMSSAAVGGTTTRYVYNALGQMIEKNVGGAITLFVYDKAGHLLGEYDTNPQPIQETVWLGDIPVATIHGNSGAVNYVHADQLGSPRMITRPSDNAILWRWDSDPFGTATPNQNPQNLGAFIYNLRLPGQYFNAETGLNYNYYRDYDAAAGRYRQSDPIGVSGGLNTYTYVRGNPVSLRDPLGWCPSNDQNSWQNNLLSFLFAPWGGYSNFLGDLQQTGWPGGSWDANLAALPPIAAETTATSVFWNGGETAQAAANAWAASNGGQTVVVAADATIAEINAASAASAANASGNVVVFQTASYQGTTAISIDASGSTWATLELPTLMANPNVTGITWNILDGSGATICTIFCPK